MKALRIGIPSSFDLTDTPPIDLRWVSILFIAGHHTTFAANALGHVEVKAILFAGEKWTIWNAKLGIKSGVVRAIAALVYVCIQHENGTVFSRSLNEGQWHRWTR